MHLSRKRRRNLKTSKIVKYTRKEKLMSAFYSYAARVTSTKREKQTGSEKEAMFSSN